MAVHKELSVLDLNGNWQMDKNISPPLEPLFALQGVNWLIRKAISVATVTVTIAQRPSATDPKVIDIDLTQVATGGITTNEKRYTDWKERPNQDHIFGKVLTQTRIVRGSRGADGKLKPNLDVQSRVHGPGDKTIVRFLTGDILHDGTETNGYEDDDSGNSFAEGEGTWVHTWIRSQDKAKWTWEQIWGIEKVNGQRCYTQRMVAAKTGSFEMGRYVYKLVD